jgi:hypothetical protein
MLAPTHKWPHIYVCKYTHARAHINIILLTLTHPLQLTNRRISACLFPYSCKGSSIYMPTLYTLVLPPLPPLPPPPPSHSPTRLPSFPLFTLSVFLCRRAISSAFGANTIKTLWKCVFPIYLGRYKKFD